jgi:hypothetical protein
MFRKLFRTKSFAELRAEKIKDYKNIVALQSMIILSALLLKDILAMAGMSMESSNVFRDVLFLLLGGVYVFILWDLLRNFTRNKRLVVVLLFFIIAALGLAAITVNPFFHIHESEQEQRIYLFFIHSVLFAVESTVILHSIYDIFAGHRLSEEKIWGSACIFLMIGISFGSLYDLINIINPGSMGVPLALGLESYTVCISYSMTIIGGHEAYPNAIPLIMNLSVVEAVWSNLFVVLLVGRLLGKPDAE